MAEVNLERKPTGPGGGMGWLWIVLGIILLAVLVWWFMRPQPATMTPQPVTTTGMVIELRSAPDVLHGQRLILAGETRQIAS
jgi:hypothetical protein